MTSTNGVKGNFNLLYG